jgi:hypothetical protein
LFLELKIRDHADEIGVPATFSDPIEGALDLVATRIDRSQGVGGGKIAIVMAMDCEFRA